MAAQNNKSYLNGTEPEPGLGAVAGAVAGLTVLPRAKSSGGKAKTTYVDASGARRTGVTSYSDPYWDGMRDYYNSMYDSRVAANNEAAENAYAQAARAAQEQRDSLNAGYRDTNRQLYRDYMDARRTLPQQMAARGYTGGLTESGQIRLNNAYGENLAVNERARLSRLSGVDAALAQKEYDARAAAARANQQALEDRYAALAEVRTRQYQQQRSDALSRAALLAGAGDYSGYGSVGLSQADADYLARMWRARNPRLAGVQSTGRVTAPSAPADSSALSVARYIQQTQGTARAVDYIAEELAAGNLFSDQAEEIRKLLRATE